MRTTPTHQDLHRNPDVIDGSRIGGLTVFDRFGKPVHLALAISILLVSAFLIASFVVDSARFQAISAGLQALGVVVALGLTVLTIRSDSRDRRTDRVLRFHQEMSEGEIQLARARLSLHMRRLGSNGLHRTMTWPSILTDSGCNSYTRDSEHTPYRDAFLISRFFERVNAARNEDAVDERLLFSLIASSAVWWSLALDLSGDFGHDKPLRELFDWARSYARGDVEFRERVDEWRAGLVADFGEEAASSLS